MHCPLCAPSIASLPPLTRPSLVFRALFLPYYEHPSAHILAAHRKRKRHPHLDHQRGLPVLGRVLPHARALAQGWALLLGHRRSSVVLVRAIFIFTPILPYSLVVSLPDPSRLCPSPPTISSGASYSCSHPFGRALSPLRQVIDAHL